MEFWTIALMLLMELLAMLSIWAVIEIIKFQETMKDAED